MALEPPKEDIVENDYSTSMKDETQLKNMLIARRLTKMAYAVQDRNNSTAQVTDVNKLKKLNSNLSSQKTIDNARASNFNSRKATALVTNVPDVENLTIKTANVDYSVNKDS